MTMPKCPKDGKPCDKLRRAIEIAEKWQALNAETLDALDRALKRERFCPSLGCAETFVCLVLLAFVAFVAILIAFSWR